LNEERINRKKKKKETKLHFYSILFHFAIPALPPIYQSIRIALAIKSYRKAVVRRLASKLFPGSWQTGPPFSDIISYQKKKKIEK